MYGGFTTGVSDISVSLGLTGPDSWLGRGPLDLDLSVFLGPFREFEAQPRIARSISRAWESFMTTLHIPRPRRSLFTAAGWFWLAYGLALVLIARALLS